MVTSTTYRTWRRQRVLAAIDKLGRPSLRDLQAATGATSTSVLAGDLQHLAATEGIELVEGSKGTELGDWQGFAAAWDAAAHLAGNPAA